MKRILTCSCGTKYLPQRYILAILCLVGVIVNYGQRVSLNLAITAMTNKSASASTSCPIRNTTFSKSTPANISGGVIDWSNTQQNAILGSFYAGYFLGHFPVGVYCDFRGARYIFFIGVVLSTIMTLFTPLIVVHLPWYATIILRILMGLGQSVLYPCISSLYAKWVPLEERSLLGAFSFAANALGIIFGSFLTGATIQLVANWRSAFYLWGVVGVIWCLIYLAYVYSEPSKHPFITDKERNLLAVKISKSRRLKIPWLAILRSLGIWAIIIGEIGHDFTIYTLMNNMPKYLSDVLHYDIAENSLASSLPYLGQWLGGVIAGKVTDYLIKKKNVSIVGCRRVLTFVGNVVPPLFIVAAGYMGCDGTAVIIMFSLNLLAKGPFYAGLKVNHLDMSVNFPGLIMAIYNGIGALAGWASPYVINACAPNNTLEEWVIVFWIVLVVSLCTTIFYMIFCTSRRQKWDVPEDEMEEFLKSEAEMKERASAKKDNKAK